MKELEGIKLERRLIKQISMSYVIIFWLLGEPSQQLTFNKEEECDKILSQIADGKGINVSYDFETKTVRIFPRRAFKMKIMDYYDISQKDLENLRDAGSFTSDLDNMPSDFVRFGNNVYTPRLIEEDENLK